ncbi:MAG: transposase, partial [Candidatus Freyarchaeota archaeon]|nr:transposase [Candidatus Jordarchaeia archaeon]
DFKVDVKKGVAVCPAGRRSVRVELRGEELDELAVFYFGKQCLGCPNYGLCTKSKDGRSLKIQVMPSPAIDKYRKKEKSVKYQKRINLRCPVEGTISKAKKHGAGKARYRGLSKVEAQQLRTAIAINVKRRVAAGLKQTRRTFPNTNPSPPA